MEHGRGCGKTIYLSVSPILIGFVRLLLGSIVLLPFAYIEMKKRNIQFYSTIPTFIVLGITGFALHYVFYHMSIAYIKASSAATIVSSIPVFVLLFTIIFVDSNVGWKSIFGILLGIFGVFLFVFENVAFSFNSLVGVMLMVIAACLWSVFAILIKKVVDDYGSLFATAMSISFGCILSMPILFFENPAQLLNLSGYEIGALLYLGVFATGLGYLLYYTGLSGTTALQASSMLYFKPPISALLATLLIGEVITAPMVAGIVVILVALYFVIGE